MIRDGVVVLRPVVFLFLSMMPLSPPDCIVYITHDRDAEILGVLGNVCGRTELFSFIYRSISPGCSDALGLCSFLTDSHSVGKSIPDVLIA